MSASTAGISALLNRTDASISCMSPEENNAAGEFSNATNSERIVELWLSQMRCPEVDKLEHDDGDTETRNSVTSDIDDGPVIMALDDLLVADNLGNVGVSRQDLSKLDVCGEVNREELSYIRAVATQHTPTSSETEGDNDKNIGIDDGDDENLMLQRWQVHLTSYCLFAVVLVVILKLLLLFLTALRTFAASLSPWPPLEKRAISVISNGKYFHRSP